MLFQLTHDLVFRIIDNLLSVRVYLLGLLSVRVVKLLAETRSVRCMRREASWNVLHSRLVEALVDDQVICSNRVVFGAIWFVNQTELAKFLAQLWRQQLLESFTRATLWQLKWLPVNRDLDLASALHRNRMPR